MSYPPEEYQVKVLNRLRQRNASQSEAFRGLIENNRELLQLNCQHRSRIAALEDLAQKGGGGGGGGGGEMQEKCDKLQRDLIESLKRNSENAALIMETTKQIQETNKILVEKETELTETQQKYEQLEEEKKVVDGVLTMVREEYSAMKIQFHRCQKQMSKLSEEHDDLVQRWMEVKTNEAERLNEINQMHTHALQEVQKAKAAAAGSAMMSGSSNDLSAFAIGEKKCDLPKGIKKRLTGHKGDVNSVCYNPAGSLLASGGNDKLIKVWNVRNFQTQSTLSGPLQSVMCVKFSPNEEFILGTSNDHTIRIWGAQDGRVKHTLTGHLGKVFAGSFSEDSKKVVSGSYDRSLKIWDMSRGYCIRTLFGQSSCTDVEFAQLANMLVSAHIDASLRFWDTRTGGMIHEVSKIHSQKITSVCLSPDSRTLLTCSRDGTIKTSDIRTYEPLKVFAHSDYRAGVDWARACFSSDGRYVATGGHTGSVFIWDVNTAKIAKKLDGHKDTVAAVIWNPHGNQLASCDKNGQIIFWE